MTKAINWTPSRRKAQSERIHQWQPWMQSTGPKSAAGKAAACRNAYKGAMRPTLRRLSRLLREQRKELCQFDFL